MKIVLLCRHKLILIFFFLIGSVCYSLENWVKTYGGTGNESGYSIAVVDDGYVAVGKTESYGKGQYDIYLVKVDVNGDTLWVKTFGGEKDDIGYGVINTDDNGLIIIGSTISYGQGWGDVYLIKTNSNGEMEWNKTYGGEDFDVGKAVLQCSDGGYIAVGKTLSYDPMRFGDAFIIRTDNKGNLLWEKKYRGEGEDSANAIIQTVDGGFIVCGLSYTGNNGDIYFFKIDASGNIEWTNSYGGEFLDEGNCIIPVENNELIIIGSNGHQGTSELDNNACLLRIDTDGNVIWSKSYGNSRDDIFCSGLSIPGGLMLAGRSNMDIFLVRTDSVGDTIWTRTLKQEGFDVANSMSAAIDDKIVITGMMNDDLFIMKTDKEGTVATGIEKSNSPVQPFYFYPNYPNPFNSQTIFPFYLEYQAHVNAHILDVRGCILYQITNQKYNIGFHKLPFCSNNFANGPYIVRMQFITDGPSEKMEVLTRKILLIN